MTFQIVCDKCRGGGVTIKHPCITCRGVGSMVQDVQEEVVFPKGIDNAQTIRINGKVRHCMGNEMKY